MKYRYGKHGRKKDFACCLRELAETHYPEAEKIVLVMDNLNTHTLSSLYAAYPAEQARRLWERFEVHHIPKHGSWLNMAEIEIGVMSRQCLACRIPYRASMEGEVQGWVKGRNGEKGTAQWRFTTQDARIKLRRLYPKL